MQARVHLLRHSRVHLPERRCPAYLVSALTLLEETPRCPPGSVPSMEKLVADGAVQAEPSESKRPLSRLEGTKPIVRLAAYRPDPEPGGRHP